MPVSDRTNDCHDETGLRSLDYHVGRHIRLGRLIGLGLGFQYDNPFVLELDFIVRA